MLQKQFTHTFFVAKTIYALFLSQNKFAHLFLSRKQFTRFFVAKTIYALCPESFSALKIAIRKPPTLFGIQYGNLQGNRMKVKFWNFQKLSPPSSCTFYLLQLISSLDLFAIQQPICIRRRIRRIRIISDIDMSVTVGRSSGILCC